MCFQRELIDINQLYIKLIYVKLSFNDFTEQAERIFQIFKIYEIDVYNFNCQNLVDIFSQEVIDNLFQLIFNSSNSELNLSMVFILCFFYENIQTKEDVLQKVINIIKESDSTLIVYELLKFICIKYQNVMSELYDKNLLDIIINIDASNTEILQKCVMLCIENIKEINSNTVTIINTFVSKSETCHFSCSETLLKIISASSMSSNLTYNALISGTMWKAILINLVSVQAINRKRAMYWLNRYINGLIFNKIEKLSVTLSKEQLIITLTSEIISDVVNLIDCLEEKQTHLIIPTLPRFENLKKSLSDNLISIHWLLIIIEKATLHESTVILKWAFKQFLNLSIELSIEPYCQLLSNFFMKTFNNSSLYFSSDSINNLHGFFGSMELQNFLNNLFQNFCQSKKFDTVFRSFLESIFSMSWNSQALLFFAESFSNCRLSHSELPFWVLPLIGKLCQSNLPTFDLKYRQFITSFLLVGFFNNHQIEISTFDEIIKIFQTFFDIEKTIFFDSKFVTELIFKFKSLSVENSHIIFEIVRNSFDNIDLFDSNFTNKIACVSFFVSVFQRAQMESCFVNFLKKITKLICEYHQNPYVKPDVILKNIICIKQICLIFSNKNHSRILPDSVDIELDFCVGHIIRFLSNQIDTVSNRDCQQHYLQLMKYFIVNFPQKILSTIYVNEINGTDTISIVINANIDSQFRKNWSKTMITEWFGKCQDMYPLDYEKLQLQSFNIDWIIDCLKDEHSQTCLFSFFSDLLDVSASCQSLISILKVIGRFVSKIILQASYEQVQIITKLVQTAWNRVLEFLSNAKKFWKLYSTFLDTLFFNSLLYSAHSTTVTNDVREEIVICLNHIVESIFEIGENKFGMVHNLGDSLHDFIIFNRFSMDGNMIDFYLELIVKFVLFGPCHRRSLRFEKKIEYYLYTYYQDQWNDWGTKIPLAESSDRVSGLLILCIADELVVSNEFRIRVIERLRNTDKQLLSMNKSCYKNYINNQLHRTRHRLYSTLLIVFKIALNSMSDQLKSICEQWMLESIKKETLSSIRHLSEWILILIYSHNNTRQVTLFELLKSTADCKPAYQCSLISIIRHLVLLNEPVDNEIMEENIIEDLILAVLAMGSAQNYNVRLHAMSFIKTIQNSNLIPVTKPYLINIVSNYISFVSQNSIGKNINKLCDNFWWSIFQPRRDICLETVFSILPRLFDLVEEEIISIDQFKVASKSIAKNYKIDFENSRMQWNDCHDSVWRVKTETFDVESVKNKNGDQNEDMQKKIQPWLTSRPDEDALKELHGWIKTSESDMVLVCSLLDKPTNIGGLARSSNIFCVDEFVVDNLRVVDNIDFKQLAVTADKWINITEVPIQSLVYFIKMKRLEGYDIVGIEQTANSVSLQSTAFKKKTVLILGNEKEGIPVELISHLDKCIEIPQFGQIRSLNVHVTGALVMWEYVKQMKLNNFKFG